MRCIATVYIVVLVADLLTGSALIIWKCAYTDADMECKLATWGTLGSLAVWLLLLLVCPFCAIKVDFYDAWEKTHDKVKQALKSMRSDRSRQIYIPSEIYLPTTLSMRGPRDKVACDVNIMASDASEDNKAAHPLMAPKIEDVVPVPAIVYTFNEANREYSRSRSTTPCLESEDA